MRIHANAKIEMLKILKRVGAKLKSIETRSKCYTLLESLPRDSIFADRKVVLWLLKNGAKVTKRMNKNREGIRYFPLTIKEHTRSKYFVAHGLLMRTR